jgi:perosamine synthetase
VSSLPHRLFTTSGRAAIRLALSELRVSAGDRVLVPSYHCPTMVSPIVAAGATPIFFPIDDEGVPLVAEIDCIDLKRVKAMLAVHYFGIPRPLSATRDFCDRRGIALIEDCAHSFFGVADGRPVGTWGDLAIASLPKFFPVPEGGLLASSRRPLTRTCLPRQSWAAEVRQIVSTIALGARHGRFAPLGPLLNAGVAARDRLRGLRIGTPTTSSQAGTQPGLDNATPLFDDRLAQQRPATIVPFIVRRGNMQQIADRRRWNYQLLMDSLTGIPGLKMLVPALPDNAIPYALPVWVERPERSYNTLRRAGVPIFRWDTLWPGVAEMHGDVGLNWSHHVYQLGCHQDLSEADIRSIALIVRRALEMAF